MPDWSYQTVFRPLLFRMPPVMARDLCLGFLGRLAQLPCGKAVINFLGHMRPDPRLQSQVAGLQLPAPIVLGALLDGSVLASGALGQFGFGMIEVGPIRPDAAEKVVEVGRSDRQRSLLFPHPLPSIAAASALARLPHDLRVPLLVCLSPDSAAAIGGNSPRDQSAAELVRRSSAVTISLDSDLAAAGARDTWRIAVQRLVRAAGDGHARPLFITIAADADLAAIDQHLQTAIDAGARGVVVEGRIRESHAAWLVGPAALPTALGAVQRLRTRFGKELSIVAGGADDPQSALSLLAAGANAVQIDVGLVYSGPGLPKRINEAVLFARSRAHSDDGQSPPAASAEPADHVGAMSWFWALLLGIAMLLGGCLALAFSATRVLLPYDEAYLQMTADELTARIPRLLHFMAHDRVTLAGTMLAVGIQYVFLAWYGIRRGWHWAKLTVVASAFCGFLSFFLFLGFGYFDPLHAFVTAVLFQFLLLAFQGRLGPPQPFDFPNLKNDWRWRLANWGQLLLVAQGLAIIVAGLTIAKIGITTVFVTEDLEFLGTTAEAIAAANPRLVPVVAHDRASFGGMLISVGLATLLPALWGVRQGAAWLWWMLAIAGTVGYATTLLVHVNVGYIDPLHLAPAICGLALLWAALSLLWPYLAVPNPAHEAKWEEELARQ